MLATLKSQAKRFRDSEDGATLVEYGIALTLAVTLGATAMISLKDDVNGTLTDAGAAMPRTAVAAPSGG